MDYVFHSGDPMANDAVCISSKMLQRLIELAGYQFREDGDELNATEFFFFMTRGQVQNQVGSDLWNKAEELLAVGQNAPGRVFYAAAS